MEIRKLPYSKPKLQHFITHMFSFIRHAASARTRRPRYAAAQSARKLAKSGSIDIDYDSDGGLSDSNHEYRNNHEDVYKESAPPSCMSKKINKCNGKAITLNDILKQQNFCMVP